MSAKASKVRRLGGRGWWTGLGIAWMAGTIIWYFVRCGLGPVLRSEAFEITSALGSWLAGGHAGSLGDPAVLLRHAAALMIALGVLLGAMAAGWWLTRPLAARAGSALSEMVLSTVLGMGAVAYLVYALGWLDLYSTAPLTGVWIAGVLAAGASWLAGMGSTLRRAGIELVDALAAAPASLRVLLVMILGLGLIMALVPEITYDPLVYHLGAPRLFLDAGGLVPTMNVHYCYPLTLQMLYLLALGLQGDVVAKLIHWACGLLLALAMIAWAAEEGRPRAGTWSGLMMLAMPMVQLALWTAGVDVGASLMAVCALWCWRRASRATADGGPFSAGRGMLVLGAVFGGLCYSTKLTAALVLPLLAGLVATEALGRAQAAGGRRTAAREVMLRLVILVVVATAVMAPWMVRAWLSTGNPVYPFLAQSFGGLDPAAAAMQHEEMRGVTPSGLWSWLALPWLLTCGMTSISWPGPGLLAAMPLAVVELLRRRPRLAGRRLAIGAVLVVVGLATVVRSTRYWMPYLALLLVPLGWAVDRAMARSTRGRRLITGLTGAVAAIGLVSVLPIAVGQYRPWPVLSGAMSPEEYRSISHPPAVSYRPPQAMYDWAARNLPASSKILLLGEDRVAGCTLPFAAAGVYDEPLLERWSRGLGSAEELLEVLQREGVTHVLVNPAEGWRLLDYGIVGWSEQTLAMVCRLWEQHLVPLHVERVREPYLDGDTVLYLYVMVPEGAPRARPGPGIGLAARSPVLWLYEEWWVRQTLAQQWSGPKPSGDGAGTEPPGRLDQRALQLRLELLEGLARRHPEVAIFGSRLDELRAAAAGPALFPQSALRRASGNPQAGAS